MKNKRLIIISFSTVIILLIPLIAMQFTDEVNWSLFDFVVAAILLISFGFLFELINIKAKTNKYKIIGWIVLFAIFLLIWAELAVGIFGTPFAGS